MLEEIFIYGSPWKQYVQSQWIQIHQIMIQIIIIL